MTKPWTGKKDNLPSSTKKEHHKERKTLTQLLHSIEDKDWEQQLKEYTVHGKTISGHDA